MALQRNRMAGATRAAVLASAVAFMAGACAHPQAGSPVAAGGADVPYPRWVLEGTGPYSSAHGRYFVGVGYVSGIRNVALARTTADNRARAEVARLFENYAALLLQGYKPTSPEPEAKVAQGKTAPTPASAKDAEPQNAAALTEELNTEQAIKNFTAATLSQAHVVDHWYHPSDGSVYSLAKLDLTSFVDNLGKLRDVPPKIRDYARKNAENAHQALAQDEAKKTGHTVAR